MKGKLVAVLMVLVIIGFIACTKDAQNNPVDCSLYPDVSYTNVATELTTYGCFGCHGASAGQTGGGIFLEGYTNFSSNAEAALGSINGDNSYEQMPQGNPGTVAQATIDKLACWIEQGKQNN